MYEKPHAPMAREKEHKMSRGLANRNDQSTSLIKKFSEQYHIEPDKMLTILKNTAFKQRGNTVVTNEQMAALLIVADRHGLSPFTKEIYAYDDKGAIVPVVSVDGWARIINEHPQFNGVEFRYADEHQTPHDGGKLCPIWCEAIIYRKDRDMPTVVREYLDETYQGPRGQNRVKGPWQSHTKRMLRHKTLIQCARIAFGFAGIYDEDEATRIIDVTPPPPALTGAQNQAAPAPAGRPSRLHNVINKTAPKGPETPADDVVDEGDVQDVNGFVSDGVIDDEIDDAAMYGGALEESVTEEDM